MFIKYKNVEIEAEYRLDGYYYFRHPITGAWTIHPAQLWEGWSEQNEEIQKQWEHLRNVGEQAEDLWEYIQQGKNYEIRG